MSEITGSKRSGGMGMRALELMNGGKPFTFARRTVTEKPSTREPSSPDKGQAGKPNIPCAFCCDQD